MQKRRKGKRAVLQLPFSSLWPSLPFSSVLSTLNSTLPARRFLVGEQPASHFAEPRAGYAQLTRLINLAA